VAAEEVIAAVVVAAEIAAVVAEATAVAAEAEAAAAEATVVAAAAVATNYPRIRGLRAMHGARFFVGEPSAAKCRL
jgi:uncharacterized membrane protein